MTQVPISGELLEALRIGRRQLSTEWPNSIKPKSFGQNFCLVLPFPETFQNSFESTYEGRYHARTALGNRLQIFLNGTEDDEEVPECIRDWIDRVGKFVAIKDLLTISFALDYTNVSGSPEQPRSAVAQLRARAKPYEGLATEQHRVAGQELATDCVAFLEMMPCYHSVDCVVAVPPSDPDKEYSLPKLLATTIATARGIDDLSKLVSTKAKRASVKGTAIGDKLRALRGTIDVEPDVFCGRTVLLVDDLYQSGTTMNYCAKLLLDAGAAFVLGLACEKTCRNDDNV